jgi:hypothetical protein
MTPWWTMRPGPVRQAAKLAATPANDNAALKELRRTFPRPETRREKWERTRPKGFTDRVLRRCEKITQLLQDRPRRKQQ